MINQKVAQGLLEAQGHRVTIAENGRQAVAAVARQTIRSGPDGYRDAGNGRIEATARDSRNRNEAPIATCQSWP